MRILYLTQAFVNDKVCGMEKKFDLELCPEMLPELADFFKLLGEPVRLRLLASICHEGAAGVNELTERLGLSQSVVSRHMSMLHEGGLVEKEQVGSRCLYSMPDDALCRLCLIAAEKVRARASRFSKLV